MANISINQKLDPLTARLTHFTPAEKNPYHKQLWAIVDENQRITGIYTTETYAQTAYQKLDYPMAYRIQPVTANHQFNEA